jgi:hypothetical protein
MLCSTGREINANLIGVSYERHLLPLPGHRHHLLLSTDAPEILLDPHLS